MNKIKRKPYKEIMYEYLQREYNRIMSFYRMIVCIIIYIYLITNKIMKPSTTKYT